MKQLYLVGYVLEKPDELAGLGAAFGMNTGWSKTIFGNQKIFTEKINLPKIYSLIAIKENVGVSNITILGISLLPNE